MGLFNLKPKQQLKNINGYIIDELTGKLIDVPVGLKVYTIPKEVKMLDSELNLANNKVFEILNRAEEIVFEDGGIEMLPGGYFTMLSTSKVKKVTLPNGIKFLGDDCINPVKTEFNIPDSVEHLGNNAFPDVQNFVIGDNVKSLGNSFANANLKLRSLEIPGSIKVLPPMLVNICCNLKKLLLHEGIERVDGNYTFSRLASLEYVEIPESFDMPFRADLSGLRPMTDKKRNISYNPCDNEMTQTLTIKKTYNGISYTFQVCRAEFAEISFHNTNAIIKSGDGKITNIDLEKLDKNAIYQVNIEKSTVQVFTEQEKQPKNNPIDSSFNFTEDELRTQFQAMYKKYIIRSTIFNNLNCKEQKMTAKKALFDIFCERVQALGNLNVSYNSFFSDFLSITRNIDELTENNPYFTEEEQNKRKAM